MGLPYSESKQQDAYSLCDFLYETTLREFAHTRKPEHLFTILSYTRPASKLRWVLSSLSLEPGYPGSKKLTLLVAIFTLNPLNLDIHVQRKISPLPVILIKITILIALLRLLNVPFNA